MKIARDIATAWLLCSLSLLAQADTASETRAAYLAVIDRPRIALKPELAQLPAVEGLRKDHLWFSADASERVPGYLLLPDGPVSPGSYAGSGPSRGTPRPSASGRKRGHPSA